MTNNQQRRNNDPRYGGKTRYDQAQRNTPKPQPPRTRPDFAKPKTDEVTLSEGMQSGKDDLGYLEYPADSGLAMTPPDKAFIETRVDKSETKSTVNYPIVKTTDAGVEITAIATPEVMAFIKNQEPNCCHVEGGSGVEPNNCHRCFVESGGGVSVGLVEDRVVERTEGRRMDGATLSKSDKTAAKQDEFIRAMEFVIGGTFTEAQKVAIRGIYTCVASGRPIRFDTPKTRKY